MSGQLMRIILLSLGKILDNIDLHLQFNPKC